MPQSFPLHTANQRKGQQKNLYFLVNVFNNHTEFVPGKKEKEKEKERKHLPNYATLNLAAAATMT